MAGQRIDNFLLRELKGAPRSLIYRILRRGEVRVNRGRIKSAYRLQPGDEVRVPPIRLGEEAPRPTPQRLQTALEAAILFEDHRIIALNKPAGMAVHGGSGLSFGVIEALRELRPHERRLELVHRLDRETSGCLLVAKRRSALRQLHELLRTGAVDKRYWALVAGAAFPTSDRVTVALRKNTLRGGERVVRVDASGKAAVSRFRRLEQFAAAALVEVRIETGRTHQIRVHAAHRGTPVVGDPKYGDPEANRAFRELGLGRMFLHARSLGFTWPGEAEPLRIEAPLDPELETLLERLRAQ